MHFSPEVCVLNETRNHILSWKVTLTGPNLGTASQLCLPASPGLLPLEPLKLHFRDVQVGNYVAIQRSDRCIHLAVITKIRKENAWVTVEWIEKGLKKSPCLRAIEKLHKQREKPRRLQLEIRAQHALDVNTRNPYDEITCLIKECRRHLSYSQMSSPELREDYRFCVCVRKRPLNQRETTMKDLDIITNPLDNVVTVHESKQKADLTRYLETQTFCFDHAFDDTTSNELVYQFMPSHWWSPPYPRAWPPALPTGRQAVGKHTPWAGPFREEIKIVLKAFTSWWLRMYSFCSKPQLMSN
ncbi:hypothetical protein MC885_018500 [Smutsia gigantea]|nr:hypothetical protein MC885_018500 [Smutsia gigantea]